MHSRKTPRIQRRDGSRRRRCEKCGARAATMRCAIESSAGREIECQVSDRSLACLHTLACLRSRGRMDGARAPLPPSSPPLDVCADTLPLFPESESKSIIRIHLRKENPELASQVLRPNVPIGSRLLPRGTRKGAVAAHAAVKRRKGINHFVGHIFPATTASSLASSLSPSPSRSLLHK